MKRRDDWGAEEDLISGKFSSLCFGLNGSLLLAESLLNQTYEYRIFRIPELKLEAYLELPRYDSDENIQNTENPPRRKKSRQEKSWMALARSQPTTISYLGSHRTRLLRNHNCLIAYLVEQRSYQCGHIGLVPML